MNSIVRSLCLGLIVWFGTPVEASWAYVTDSSKHPAPNYYTFQPPLLGGSYTDPVFGTSIKRMSNALSTANLASGGNLVFILNEYATMTPFNLDNSKILIQHQSYFVVYDGAGNYLKGLPFEISASSEPRWSRSDPNVLYYKRGNQLMKRNVATDTTTVVHTFSEYSTISGKGESDISFDGNHFAFAGDNRFVFVYEISTDTKGPVLDSAGRGFDSLYITPNNNVTISWLTHGTSRYNGIELFDRNMNFQRQLATSPSHMDVTRDVNGDELLVRTNSADVNPIPNCNNGIEKIRLSDGQKTCLLSLDWSLAVHVSGPDNSGWVFVEAYAPADPDPASSGWVAYTNEVIQIKLDGTEVRRLLHHRSRPFNGYNWTPRVSASRDGSRLVYSSNYALQGLLGYPTEYSDAYLVNLGSSSSGGTGGTNTTPLAVATASLPSGTQNTAYNATLAATGGTTPYLWSVASGSLPVGLTLGSSTGEVFGTSTGTGTSNFTVQALDASSATATKALSLTINASGDSGDTSTPTTSTTRFEEDHAAVSYSGPWADVWKPVSRSFFSGGNAVEAMDAGSRATFTFTGSAVRWFGYRDEWSGIANVYLDGQLKATVDTYATPAKSQDVLFAATGLTVNTHTLVVEVTGTRSSLSGGAWVWIDAFEVDNTTGSSTSGTTGGSTDGGGTSTGTVEQDNSAVTYNGPWAGVWKTVSRPSFSGGTAAEAMDKKSTATFSFTGTGVSWIGYRDAWSGIAFVYVDGTRVAKIDTFSPTDTSQAVIYTITGLSPGNHTLKIEVTGQRNRSSGGAWVWVDAFQATP